MCCNSFENPILHFTNCSPLSLENARLGVNEAAFRFWKRALC